MQSILDAINEWIKEILIGAINGNLSTMFGDVNEKVGTIAAEVGQTPQGWNANIFSMIQTLSENVIVPIAGLVITYVLCYELISMVTEKNCILLDDGDECVCPQLISYSLLCKWFRAAVLPADRLLYAELYQTGDKKKCTECGAFFASTSNSVKYCPVCRKRITRRQAAERMRKRRTPVTQ